MGSIACPLNRAAQSHPDSPAIIAGSETISYQDLNVSVGRLASSLTQHGIQKNSRVAIFSPNTPKQVALIYALWRLKAVACPLSVRLPATQITEQLNRISADVFLTTDSSHLNQNSLKIKTVNIGEINPGREDNQNIDTFDLNQECSIIFTSGSNDKPKAALHTIANHYFNALGSNEHITLQSNDRWLVSLPLYHIGGLSLILRNFLGKATLIIPEVNEALHTSIVQYLPTHISLVSTQMFRLLDNNDAVSALKKSKAILLGGGPIPDSLIEKTLKLNLPVHVTYGLTEMSSQVATTPKIKSLKQKGEAKVLNYRKIKIAPDGEILLNGEVLFRGYVEEHTTTDSLKGGWFHSNDVGFTDGQGCLTITGRKDNMFISGGENIQPEEIERYLLDMTEIQQAAIVPKGDKEFGARPVAFIQFKPNEFLSADDIIQRLQINLPRFKIPKEFHLWPKTQEEGLKVSRKKLTEYLN